MELIQLNTFQHQAVSYTVHQIVMEVSGFDLQSHNMCSFFVPLCNAMAQFERTEFCCSELESDVSRHTRDDQ